MFYEVTVKSKKEKPNGKTKIVTEQFLCDNCVFFAEAEAAGLQGEYDGDNDVTVVRRSDIREIVNPQKAEELLAGAAFYRAVLVETFTDDKGREKAMRYPVLVIAHNVGEATVLTQEYMKQGFDNMRLEAVAKSRLKGVLVYDHE